MKDRAGPVGRVSQLAAGVAAAAQRRRQARDPRVLVYDRAGHGRALSPADPAYQPLLDTGAQLIDLGLGE